MLFKIFKPVIENVWKQSIRNMSEIKESTAEKVAAMTANELVRKTVKVSDWNKKMLVLAGRFKSMKEVPDTLPIETIERARSNARIRVANYTMALTVVGCIIMIISGKRAAERGETITQTYLDLHRDYNEKAKAEEEAKNKSV